MARPDGYLAGPELLRMPAKVVPVRWHFTQPIGAADACGATPDRFPLIFNRTGPPRVVPGFVGGMLIEPRNHPDGPLAAIRYREGPGGEVCSWNGAGGTLGVGYYTGTEEQNRPEVLTPDFDGFATFRFSDVFDVPSRSQARGDARDAPSMCFALLDWVVSCDEVGEEVVANGTMTLCFQHHGDFGGKQRERVDAGIPASEPDMVEVLHTSAQDLVRWANATGDFNPFHWYRQKAAERGLPDNAAHGPRTLLAWGLHVAARWCDGDPAGIIRLNAPSFKRPLHPQPTQPPALCRAWEVEGRIVGQVVVPREGADDIVILDQLEAVLGA